MIPRSGRTYGVLALCLVLLAVVGVVVVRAVSWNGSVSLLANWTGLSETQFRDEVIAPFEAKEHIHVLYQGSSAESQVLDADVESGSAPDIAVLPGPGELADYVKDGQLQPLDDLMDAGDFAAPWAQKIDGHNYWVPIKADLKSSVWYPKGMRTVQLDADAARPGSWCLAMVDGATSGWPGTDWLEDILLQQAGPGAYQSWAQGSLNWNDARVRRAWTTWGTMVGAGQEQYVRPALTTRYDGVSRRAVGGGPACTLEHQASFVRTDAGWHDGAAYVSSRELIPQARTGQDAWEVSGDLAALLHSTPQARKLIRYLARSDVQQTWSLSQSGFSADRMVKLSAYGSDKITRNIAGTLNDRGVMRCYDASDAMPSAIRDAFQLAALRYLADPSTLTGSLRALEQLRGRTERTPLTEVCGDS